MGVGSAIVGGDRPDRLVIYGRPSRLFGALTADAAVWQRFPGLEVRHARSRLDLVRLAWGRPSYVIPIWPSEALRCPHWWWMLRPGRTAIRALHDKLEFARYARRQGLEALTPRTFLDGEALQFPLAVKPADGTDGRGVAFVENAAELSEVAGRRLVLQERIAGDSDLATHLVCRAGRVLWHGSYRYQLAGSGIQTAASIVRREPYRASGEDIAAFERLLAPLRYDGPAVIDWRRRPDGRLVVFEINPRFGSSLMRPENEADLAAAVTAVLANAQAPGWMGSR